MFDQTRKSLTQYLIISGIGIAIPLCSLNLLQSVKASRILAVYAADAFGPLLVVAAFAMAWRKLKHSASDTPAPYSDVKVACLDGTLLGISILLFQLKVISAWIRLDHPSCFGGLLPFSDAYLYFEGSESMLFTGHLDEWNCRRPINGLLLALRLALCGHNYRCALLVQAAITATACYALARIMWSIVGVSGALLTFAILYRIAGEQLPSSLSEPLGLSLGALSAILIFQSVIYNRSWLLAPGAMMLTLALLARSGPFVILPGIVIWAGFFFKGTRRFNFSLAATICSAFVMAYVINVCALAYYSGGNSPSGNFGYHLYGLARGGAGWRAIFYEFPQTRTMADAEINKFAMSHAMENIRAHPEMLLLGLGKGLLQLTIDAFPYFASLVGVGFDPLNYVIAGAVIAGIYVAWKRELVSRTLFWLFFTVVIGAFLSGAVTWQDAGPRTFAAGYPLLVLGAGIGIAGLFGRGAPLPETPVAGREFSILPLLFSVASVAILLLGPGLAYRLSSLHLEEPSGPNELVAYAGKGVPHLNIRTEGDDPGVSFAPDVALDDMQRFLLTTGRNGTIAGPRTIVMTYGISNGDHGVFWIVSPRKISENPTGMMRFHGSYEKVGMYRYFYVDK